MKRMKNNRNKGGIKVDPWAGYRLLRRTNRQSRRRVNEWALEIKPPTEKEASTQENKMKLCLETKDTKKQERASLIIRVTSVQWLQKTLVAQLGLSAMRPIVLMFVLAQTWRECDYSQRRTAVRIDGRQIN